MQFTVCTSQYALHSMLFTVCTSQYALDINSFLTMEYRDQTLQYFL